MHPNFYFDIAALVVLSVLLITILVRKMTQGRENVIFLFFLLISMLSTGFSLATGLASNWPGAYPVELRYVMHTFYLLFRNLIGPCYAFYIVTLTDTWKTFVKSIHGRILIILPFSVVFVLLMIVNPLTKKVFYIDQKLQYHRGDYFIILYFAAVLYLVYALGYIAKFHNLFERTKVFSLISLGPLTVISVIVQLIYPNLLVEMFCTMIANLIMFLAVHRPEEAMDSQTGLKNMAAYVEDTRRHEITHKATHTMVVRIANSGNLFALIGYDGTHRILNKIAGRLKSLALRYTRGADVYHLGNGVFHYAVDSRLGAKLETIAEDVNAFLREPVMVGDMSVNIIAYVSIVRCPEDVPDYPALLRYSNELTMQCEYNGQVIYAHDVIKGNMSLIIDNVEEIIEDALANNNIHVYYQPIYSVAEQRFTSAEALLRLMDPKRGFISPGVVIPVAEKSGLIHKVGAYVIEEVCRFIASEEFKKTGMEYIELNLSVTQCMQKDLADNILDTMKKYGVRPDQINLEITESAVGYSQNTMMDNLNTLAAAGVTFSLDDFGTGYSNFTRMVSLPLKIVKIDKSFVDRMSNPDMKMVVLNIIKLLKDMKKQIVVEGIETADLAKVFADYECEYIQGYYYAKPMPLGDMMTFLEG